MLTTILPPRALVEVVRDRPLGECHLRPGKKGWERDEVESGTTAEIYTVQSIAAELEIAKGRTRYDSPRKDRGVMQWSHGICVR